MNGNEVLDVCQTTGQDRQNRLEQRSSRRFGVYVPYEQYNEISAAQPLQTVEDLEGNRGLRGYASDLWFTDSGQVAPPC